MTYRTETTYPDRQLTEIDEVVYSNRYEAIGAAIVQVRAMDGSTVVVHQDNCRWRGTQVACPCRPILLGVD